jgi:2-haloacid dehalogenase
MTFDAFVFDAYGTLFDVHSLTALAETLAPGQGHALAQTWRTKQLEYTWFASIMSPPLADARAGAPPAADATASTRPRDDFARITAHALDYAVSALIAPIDAQGRQRLLDAYLTLTPFADAARTLQRLAPRARWILSNGTLAMLQPLVQSSALASLIDGVLSVDAAGVYKPSPRVYQLAVDALRLPPARIAFVSANGWDAAGAKAFGFTTFWINRVGLPVERHAPEPDYIVASLSDVATIASSSSS